MRAIALSSGRITVAGHGPGGERASGREGLAKLAISVAVRHVGQTARIAAGDYFVDRLPNKQEKATRMVIEHVEVLSASWAV